MAINVYNNPDYNSQPGQRKVISSPEHLIWRERDNLMIKTVHYYLIKTVYFYLVIYRWKKVGISAEISIDSAEISKVN